MHSTVSYARKPKTATAGTVWATSSQGQQQHHMQLNIHFGSWAAFFHAVQQHRRIQGGYPPRLRANHCDTPRVSPHRFAAEYPVAGGAFNYILLSMGELAAW